MKKTVSSFIVCVLALLTFVSANILVGWGSGFGGWDVTSEKNYTLSAAAEELVGSLKSSVTFRLYVSENLGSYDWDMGGMASQAVGVLNRYRLANENKVRVEVFRVKTGSDYEKQALKDGVLPLSDGENDFYFGLKVMGEGEKYTTIPVLVPRRKHELENDINRAIRLVSQEQPVVGIFSPKLSWWSNTKNNSFRAISAMLKEYYTVAKVREEDVVISQDIDVLLVFYPFELPKVFSYALDQYVMRGGNVIFVVDPYSEQMHKQQGYPPRPDEKTAEYLRHWGVNYVWDNVCGNIKEGEKITDSKVRNFIYPLWFFTEETSGKRLHFRTPGELKVAESSTFESQILADSGREGGVIPVSAIRYAPKSQIMAEYVQDNKARGMIMSVSGKLKSHFSENILQATDSEENVQPYIPFAYKNATMTVIADSDFLADDAWVLSFDENNPVYGTIAYADNAAFLVETIDRMSGTYIPSIRKNKKQNLNIAEVLYTKSFLKFADEKDLAEREEARLGAYLNKLRRINADSEDIVFRKKLDEAEKKHAEQVKILQHINAQIKADADKNLLNMLVLSLLAGPAVILLLIFAGVKLVRVRFKMHCSEKR